MRESHHLFITAFREVITAFREEGRPGWITLYVGPAVWKALSKRSNCFSPVASSASRLASRVSALGLGRTQAAERRSTAHADRWCRMEFVHALDIRTACRSRLQPQGRWGRSNAKLSGGQSCMSLSSYSECNGHDLVLPDLPQLPAADSAYKSRLCCAECDGPVHG